MYPIDFSAAKKTLVGDILVAILAEGKDFGSSVYCPSVPRLRMSKRGPQSTPSKDKDAEKHHKGEKANDEVTLKDLGKMMSTITMDMSSMQEDLAVIKGNMVTKDELEEFKEKQVEFKHSYE